jgi:hypothetical protein
LALPRPSVSRGVAWRAGDRRRRGGLRCSMRRVLAALMVAPCACRGITDQLVVTFDTDARYPPRVAHRSLDGRSPLRQAADRRCSTTASCAPVHERLRRHEATSSDEQGIHRRAASGRRLDAPRLYLARFAEDRPTRLDHRRPFFLSPPFQQPGLGWSLPLDRHRRRSRASPSALGSVASVVGTWPGAKRVGCDETGLPRPTSACVAGAVLDNGNAGWSGARQRQAGAGTATLAILSPRYAAWRVTVGALSARARNNRPEQATPRALRDRGAAHVQDFTGSVMRGICRQRAPRQSVRSNGFLCKGPFGDVPTAARSSGASSPIRARAAM